MPFKKKNNIPYIILAVLLALLIIFYSIRLYSIQIANRTKYSTMAKGSVSTRTAILKAPRGEILDRYGRQIAINRDGYNVVFSKAYVKDDLNDVILSLIDLFNKSGVKYIDKLPISNTAPYTFTDNDDSKKVISTLGLAKYATAENCYNQLVKKFKIENYNETEQRAIMGVRYGMLISDFSISYPYTFAEDIPADLMRKICESGFALSGVTVDVVPFRQYVDTTLAVNLIGTVAPIFEEDWETGAKYKEKGYQYNDKVGKGGIEEYAEEYLHGTDGEITYYLDSNGAIIESKVTKEPIPGKTVMLTLDKRIQKTAQDSLSNTIRQIRSEGSPVVAGAAVVTDVKTGGVICGANYPTYDVSTFSENYEELSKDPSLPLTNRAFQGVYPVGSSIKPAVATAAMENGKYTIGETITCVRTYRYFNDYQPNCMHTHGPLDLKHALSYSCNYFFFELGKRVGATTLTKYFKDYGLGVKTGVEVDDSSGILVEPDGDGLGGDTLQMSIGQLNAFTPLQLSNYIGTFSNGGTHYKVTLVDKIVSYDLKKTEKDNKPTVLNTIKMSEETKNAIKEGMLSVTEDGTGSRMFSTYGIKLGGKTGTSQSDKGADHSIFVAFAPYDNPQIAVSVVLEHGDNGAAAMLIARNIFDEYFFSTANDTSETQPTTVIK
ncbi:MAG: penicillin-binding protein [Clostridia bacterium]|nr:penicillin-binding protein [Clostridia bacterium]